MNVDSIEKTPIPEARYATLASGHDFNEHITLKEIRNEIKV